VAGRGVTWPDLAELRAYLFAHALCSGAPVAERAASRRHADLTSRYLP